MGVIVRTSSHTADLLDLEDHPEILEPSCPRTRLPLWPLARWEVLDAAFTHFFGEENAGARLVDPGARSRAMRVPGSLRSAWHTFTQLHRSGPAAVLVLGDSAVRMVGSGPTALNPMTDYFYEAAPSITSVAEALVDGSPARPGVLDQRSMRSGAGLYARVASVGAESAARGLLSSVNRRMSQLFGSSLPPGLTDALAAHVARQATALRWYEGSWARWLRATGAQLVLKDGCSYGGAENVGLVRVARRMGVRVAEAQHGLVNPTHLAYNMAPTVAASADFRATLPDTILTYGDWWHDGFELPVELHAIGHPHRSRRVETLTPRSEELRREVLVLGNGIDTRSTLAFCSEISSGLPDGYSQVRFRPHPQERDRVRQLPVEQVPVDVVIDQEEDIYESFARAGALISEASTGNYEAVGLVPKIFIWGNVKGKVYSATSPFAMVEDSAQMLDALSDPDRGAVSAELAEEMWAPEWRKRYLAFLERSLSGSLAD